MRTIKTLNYHQGALSVSEFELEAYQRYLAQHAEYRAFFPELEFGKFSEYQKQVKEVNGLIDEPVIEPLTTWHVGTFDSEVMDAFELLERTGQWLGKRTLPLDENEIPELKEFLQTI